MISRIKKYLFGYDVFISYSRKDGSLYAAGLANVLASKKLTCFIDQWGTEPGEKLPNSLKRTLQLSKLLVLIGSEKASTSNSVEKEIDLCLHNKKRLIIPIDFQSLENSRWFSKIAGLARSNENKERLLNGIPSDEIIQRIVSSIGYSTQNKRLRRLAIGISIILIILIGASVWSTLQLKKEQIEVLNQRKIADELTSQNHIAQENLLKLEKYEKVILDSVKKAKEQNKILLDEITESKKQLDQKEISIIKQKEKSIEIIKEQLNELKGGLNDKGLLFSTIFFDYDRTIIKPEFKTQLNKIIALLNKYPDLKLEIHGFSFEIGSDHYNIKLSERRAFDVANYFFNNGISKSRVNMIGNGESKLNPIIVNDMDEELQKKLYQLKSVVKIILNYESQ